MVERVDIPSDMAAARALGQRMLEQVARHGYSGAASFAIKLALEEGLCNAIKHGNSLDPRKKVHVAFEITPERAEITIRRGDRL